MRGAAPHHRNRVRLLLAVGLAAVVVPNAAAADPRPNAFVLPELWGVAANASFRSTTFARLQRAGINVVVIDSRRLRLRQVRRLSRAAGQARLGLRVVQPAFLPPSRTVVDARTACDAFRNAHPGSACALWESSASSALTLAQSGAADLVVVRLAGPGALRALARSPAGRILAIVPLGRHFRARTWKSAIQAASSSATLDLAFAPRRARQKTVSTYLKLLDKSGATTRDRRAPSSPTGLKIARQTQTTLGLSWNTSYDKRGVAGYDFLVDGALLGSTTSTAYVRSNLPCGTSHIVAVKAFDVAGNRSAKSSLRAETRPCGLPPPPLPWGSNDTIPFPRIGQYNAFSFGDGSTQARFQLNVFLGCNPGVADRSYARNPQQVNLIIPTPSVSPNGVTAGPNCGAAASGFAVSYGAYASITSPIASPYPGIGTIRAWSGAACPLGDYACFLDGTRITAPEVLNFASSDTADWAAKVRAHFYLKDLSTGSHPGVHGIWGDNFAWWAPYFKSRRSAGGSAPRGPAQAWDDGSVENVTKLHSLVPVALLGANGAGLACGFGDVYVGSVPGKDCRGAGDTTLWEGYGGYHYVHDPAVFDSAIAQFRRWLSTPADDGHPKRGMLNVFGIAGQNALGHVLTAQDQRLELAYACIGGLYAWIINGEGWGTTAIPGTPAGSNFAIPEMGDSGSYPRGWLGLPTSAAVKFASGEWKRTFSGGTVYANATASAWSVDGHTVPAQDGLFVKR
jgi:hypothetical protein